MWDWIYLDVKDRGASQDGFEGYESNEPQEAVPPTKKPRQNVFGTLSKLGADEMEDLEVMFVITDY